MTCALLVVLSMLLVFSAGASAVTYSERPVCVADRNQIAPSIDGSHIAWEDCREEQMVIGSYWSPISGFNVIPYLSNEQIWTADVSATGVTAPREIEGAYGAGFVYPCVSGQKVVSWAMKPLLYGGFSEVSFYDLSGLPSDPAGPSCSSPPKADGGRMVFEDDGSLYVQDLATGAQPQLLPTGDQCSNPNISGDLVAYQWLTTDPSTGNSIADIAVYNLATHQDNWVCQNPADESAPDISGNRIVYSDNRNGTLGVFMYDVSTQTERTIASGPSIQDYPPAISGNKIVWTDNRNGNNDIYLYDLATNTEQRVTTSAASQAAPDISGDRIVWVDDRNGTPDIYVGGPSTGSGAFLPSVSLSTPKAPGSVKHGKSFAISGTLSPRHAKGSTSAVRLLVERKVGAAYVAYKTIKVKIGNYKSYSSYKVSLKIPGAGTYRVRAFAPADSQHSETYSNYRNLTVK